MIAIAAVAAAVAAEEHLRACRMQMLGTDAALQKPINMISQLHMTVSAHCLRVQKCLHGLSSHRLDSQLLI